MEENLYSVVLQYDATDAVVRQLLNERLRRFIKSTDKLDKMMASGNLLLKRNTNRHTAEKIAAAFKMEGVACRLVKQSSQQEATGRTLKIKLEEEQPATTMVCPKCMREQSWGLECRHCGVILAKARHVVPAAPPQESRPLAEAEKPPLPKILKSGTGFVKRMMPKISHLHEKTSLWLAAISRWSQKPTHALLQCGILAVLALILEMGLLSLGHGLWYLYTWTPVGEHYQKAFEHDAQIINAVLYGDTLATALQVVLIVALTNILIGAIAQPIHIIRYFYEPMGFFVKLILWFLPSAAISAWYLSQQPPMPPFYLAFVMTLVPSLCLMHGCLQLCMVVLPEMGDVAAIMAKYGKNRAQMIKALINMMLSPQNRKNRRAGSPQTD